MASKTQRTPQKRARAPRRRPLAATPAPARRRPRDPDGFPVEKLEAAVERAEMSYPQHLIGALAAAVDSGKHVIFTGPPGTGKTTLAYMAADVARSAMLCSGYLPTTATSGWTTAETVGSLVTTREGMVFRPGLFVDAMQTGRWLILDEINRADLDLSFGPLFTVLSYPVSWLPLPADMPLPGDPSRWAGSWIRATSRTGPRSDSAAWSCCRG